MKSVAVHAVPRAQRRLLVSNYISDDEDDDPPGPDELDVQVLYRRPRVADAPKAHQDDSVSDYVGIRLAVARAKALQKFNQKYS